MSKEFNMKTDEMTDIDMKELLRNIKEGNTSGRIDFLMEAGRSKHIYWELKVNVWIDE